MDWNEIHITRSLICFRFIADRLSAFGFVELLMRTANANDNDNDTLIDAIENDLLSASRAISNEVFNVRVVELEGDPGSNILCHYEILLNGNSTPSNSLLHGLALINGTNFANVSVAFRGKPTFSKNHYVIYFTFEL